MNGGLSQTRDFVVSPNRRFQERSCARACTSYKMSGDRGAFGGWHICATACKRKVQKHEMSAEQEENDNICVIFRGGGGCSSSHVGSGAASARARASVGTSVESCVGSNVGASVGSSVGEREREKERGMEGGRKGEKER